MERLSVMQLEQAGTVLLLLIDGIMGELDWLKTEHHLPECELEALHRDIEALFLVYREMVEVYHH